MKATCSNLRRGFTMIELVVVLMILGIAVGVAAPSLRGWGMGAKLRDATQQFVSATRYARAEAAAQATTIRLSLDPAESAYVMLKLEGGEFVETGGEFGSATILPSGFTLQLVSGGSDRDAIDFYPNLRTTPAVVRITTPTGQTADIECVAAAGSFRVAGSGGTR